MISSRFVKLWEPRYNTQKFPEDFYLRHIAGAQNAEQPERLKEHLLALIHWKDGKARAYVPGEKHAKPNTVKPICILTNTRLANFAQSFRGLAQAVEKDMTMCTEKFRVILSKMWKKNSVVIPAFILHVARPDRLPIIDQHTVRAFLALTRGEIVEEPEITWPLWNDYVPFFQDAVVNAGYYHNPEERCKVDRALFAWGKSLKHSAGSKQKLKTHKRHKLTHTELAPEKNGPHFTMEENMINPHQGKIILNHNFRDVYSNLEKRGETESRTAVGTFFTAIATITRRGIHNGEATIRFLNNGRENARAYRCCWGYYYNCNGTRIGMYCQALDVAISMPKQ